MGSWGWGPQDAVSAPTRGVRALTPPLSLSLFHVRTCWPLISDSRPPELGGVSLCSISRLVCGLSLDPGPQPPRSLFGFSCVVLTGAATATGCHGTARLQALPHCGEPLCVQVATVKSHPHTRCHAPRRRPTWLSGLPGARRLTAAGQVAWPCPWVAEMERRRLAVASVSSGPPSGCREAG